MPTLKSIAIDSQKMELRRLKSDTQNEIDPPDAQAGQFQNPKLVYITPYLSAQLFSICSSDFPLVSGIYFITKAMIMTMNNMNMK